MLHDIVILQKREIERKLEEPYVEREIELKKFKNDLIKVIIGPRRSGKSFFSAHILKKLGNFGYANFDDEKLVDLKNYDELVNSINTIYKKPKYLLLDEIQNLDKWELFVNRLQRQGYDLVITGSNANLLSRELSTHLTGRHVLIRLLPFSFKEILSLEKKELTEEEKKEKAVNYMKYGGYPELVVKDLDYKDYLSTLFTSIIYKDIVKRFRIRSPSAIEDLATYLISNIAKDFSYNTLAKVTKCRSAHTVEKYLNYLEQAFLFFRINRFTYKVKEQLSSPKKIYCIDNGFIYAKSLSFSQDIGRIFENLVAVELKRTGEDVYYWKNVQHEEVDFILKDVSGIKQLIQVCYSINNIKTKEREVRALLKAGKELKCKNLLVITDNYEGEEKIEWFGIKGIVKFVPLWKWLLL